MIQPLGDSAVRVVFGKEISEQVHGKVRAFCRILEEMKPSGIIEWMPSYTAVTIFYDALHFSYKETEEWVKVLVKDLDSVETIPARTWSIPVCYEEEFAPDIEGVGERLGLHPNEIIDRHTKPLYTIFMLGFIPGFPYLGGMDSSIAAPRLEKPRSSVPAGSVGIAGEQTGIYSLTSPGGWRIIGRTPLKLYDRKKTLPVFLEAGDKLRFQAVTKQQFQEIQQKVEEGNFELERLRGEQR
ncbi:5-oxoprolinase subunit PxpB [Alkalicoccus halolimnae]|uniref:5-oxoprolinase subunit PxpB n=1 Tax=Alkalicoccus halolimnae TaxID=1667239 RepID=A0A5C7F8A2_9BACI|nr:5-oxoprolinase subunit PxpB [Alkalicoccus halolimnae]TXF85598.1 5-oxoprolinase subunit PxpB [Alkalicoccus halolimnae]